VGIKSKVDAVRAMYCCMLHATLLVLDLAGSRCCMWYRTGVVFNTTGVSQPLPSPPVKS
jgi:hypothetical protein